MRADAAANRSAIVIAAKKQFAAHGLNVAFSTIADDAGVGIATFYRNFATREALVQAVVQDLEHDYLAIVNRAEQAMDKNMEQGWARFVNDVFSLRAGALVPSFAAEFVHSGNISEEFVSQRSHIFSAVGAILHRAKSAGLVRGDITPEQFQMGMALITRPLPDVAAPALTKNGGYMVDVFLRGLRP